MKYAVGILCFLSLGLTACGRVTTESNTTNLSTLPPIDTASDDGAVVHGRAVYLLTTEQQTAWAKIVGTLWEGYAYASDGITTVTYTNSASTNFQINVNNFNPGSFTGNTLALGNVALSVLSDNNLKVCGTAGNTKCSSAVIRVFTTGSVAGFVNSVDGYGVPVYTGTLNPSQQVGLQAAGSVPVQTLALPSSKHTVSLTDFPQPNYTVTADFSNGGAGSYTMTYVVEYALLP